MTQPPGPAGQWAGTGSASVPHPLSATNPVSATNPASAARAARSDWRGERDWRNERDWREWREWIPEGVMAGSVLLLGLFEIADSRTYGDSWVVLVLAVLVTSLSVGLCRKLPAAALGLVWALCLLQVLAGTQLLIVQLSFVAVFFGAARWGSPATMLASLLSIPVATGAGLALVLSGRYNPLPGIGYSPVLFDAVYRLGSAWVALAGLGGLALLGLPWLAGLALRYSERAASSRSSQIVAEEQTARALHESRQAQEIARLRDQQATLARDVHDVVGHSLAVILAQAESAQFVPDTDVPKLKQTMLNIATSARASLQDVRRVLTPAGPEPSPEQPGELDALIDGVRASGHDVVSHEQGLAQPMPPELGLVAYRVLQEMLTNAIRHGRRDQPVVVERLWPDGAMASELRIEVRNGAAAGPQHPGGHGLDGMRRRLESVGGRLDVRRREEATGLTFSTTAWVPVRPVTPA